MRTARVDLDVDQTHLRRTHEPGDERVCRMRVDFARTTDLLQNPLAQHGNTIAHRHGLDLIVRDVERRRTQFTLECSDLRASTHTQFGVEIRQRLVHAEHLGAPHDRSSHCHSLTLTAGQFRRFAFEEILEFEHRGDLADAGCRAVLGHSRVA